MPRIASLVFTVLALIDPALVRAESPPPIFPPALRSGDTVAVVAPAGRLERDRIELARTRLQRMGFKVRIPENLYRRRGYLAGDDNTRAEELMAAFRDPKVKAVFPGTGGYGVTRMLDRLDYDVIRRNPKVLLGFSDITGLHLAIQRKTGLVTFHGPVIAHGLGSRENLTDFSAEYLWRALLYKSYFDWSGDSIEGGYAYQVTAEAGTLRTLAPGRVEGRLTGGNLSLICALMGTPYEIETEGRILFLEDTNEEPYRVDRYLSQLRLAGKLDHVSGVILGMFTGCDSQKGDDSLSLPQVMADYFADLGVPVIAGFPAGHYKYNATLPMNVRIGLDASARKIRVLENPVQLEEPSPPPSVEPTPPDEPPAEIVAHEPVEPKPDPADTQPAEPILPEDEFERVPDHGPLETPIERRVP